VSTERPYLPLTVSAHVHPETAVSTRIYASENRVVMTLSGDRICHLDLYTTRAELVRLRDAFTAAVVDLDAAQAALDADLTDSQDAA
jgi:hypothetical protein